MVFAYSFRKVTVIGMIILLSGITPVLSDFYTETSQNYMEESYLKVDDINIQNENLIDESKITISSGKQNRILLYESYEMLEKAVKELSNSKITHKFKFRPALTTVQISESEIPQEGLVSVTDNTKSITTAVENNGELGKQYEGWDLATTAEAINVIPLHQMGLTGDGVKVAVLDSGVRGELPSFNNVTEITIEALENITEFSPHATHVAGILAGNGIYNIDGKNKQFKSTGMAKNVDLYSIRVLDDSGFGEVQWIVEGIDRAVNESVDIISLSLSSELYSGPSDIHIRAINDAIEKGIVVVSAAGNLGPLGSGIGIPGALQQVISVGAANIREEDGVITSFQFSAIGPRINDYPSPDIIAPGVDVLSVDRPNGEVRADTGTSMATPHVSGGIALLKEAFPNATINQIREALLASGRELNSYSEPVEKVGRGIVDFNKAYHILNQTTNESTQDTTLAMSTAPRVIKDENIYFRHQIYNKTKTLPFFIHSSRNVTLKPFVDMSVTHGVEIGLPDEIDVKDGLNKFYMNITVTLESIEHIWSRMYFEDNTTGLMLPYANITYTGLVRFPQANILFDSSKDFDTDYSTYFGGHSVRGQFSQYVKSLEEEGHTVHDHHEGNITIELLSNYDILIIANPDLDYSSNEIEAIRDFVITKGKSILIIAGGGLVTAEEYTYDRYNAGTLQSILLNTGLGFKTNDQGFPFTSIKSCEAVVVIKRYEECVDKAETTKNQDVLTKLVSFPHYGPELEVKNVNNVDVQTIALMENNPVILSSQLSSNGRILLFSSPLAFDNRGQIDGFPAFSDHDKIEKSNKLSIEAVNWLIEPRSIKVAYTVNGKNVGDEVDVDQHENLMIRFAVFNPEGTRISLNENELTANRVLEDPEKGFNFTKVIFTLAQDNYYEYTLTLDRFGTYEFYIYIQDPQDGLISSDGHIVLNSVLRNFKDQDEIRSIGLYLFFTLMVSWAIFVYNEGGRKLLRKKEIEAKEV